MRRFLVVVWLLALWLVLWREASWANVVSGIAVGIAVLVVFPGDAPGRPESSIRPLALLKFLGYFTLKLVESNVVLAREILTRRDSTETGIIAIPLPQGSEVVAVIIANAISLTPGTLTLEVRHRPRTLFVHVLHLHDIERVRADIHELAALALRAFGEDPTTTSPAAAGEPR